MHLNLFSKSSAQAAAGYVETVFDGAFAAYKALPQYTSEEQPAAQQWTGSNLSHIPTNDSDQMPPIEQYFGDLFKHLWTPALGPRPLQQQSFLAQTRAPFTPPIPSARPPVPLRNVKPLTQRGAPSDWKFHESIERVSGYSFRGDGRGPEMIKSADGFQPNAMRTDDHYIKNEVFDFFQRYMASRYNRSIQRDKIVLEVGTGDPVEITPDVFLGIVKRSFPSKDAKEMFFYYTNWRALAKSEELHLGRHVDNQALKGYVSTSRATTVAKGFAIKGKTEAWVYCLRFRGSFVVPKKGDTWGKYDEQEVAVPGAIPWADIVAYRKVVGTKFDPAGRIYMRRSLEGADKGAWDTIFHLLSGKKQG